MSAWLPLRRWALSSSFSEGSEAHGYLTLASGSDPPEAYIVAIHGLCGHRIKTWTSDDGTFWLRDLLAHQVRTTRILTFGYDADARDLLHGLEQDRTNFSGQGKPVIFICHSLGGIVFKKAIVRAHELTQTYGDIVNSTKGVIFLGVPHTGSAHASWASALSILKAVTLGAVDSNRAFMEGLRENSAEFYEISKSFIPRSVNMAIKTFYETREVGFGPSGIMVSARS
jgi:triacylglycerol esterase/lipase EstA (alpha/beta hydrolase family)